MSERDYVKKLKAKAESGNAAAQSSLGDLYDLGDGVRKNREKAVSWFRKAYDNGDAYAAYRLGDCYYEGLGVPKDRALAVRWYRRGAERGNRRAQYALAWCYYHAEGVRRNRKAAFRWYTAAAQNGDVWAQNNLGCMYRDGDGTKTDHHLAVRWLRRAAAKGDDNAQCSLAYAYFYGLGVKKNWREAVRWYRKSARKGNEYAQGNLGFCCRDGEGVKQNRRWAIYWLAKAVGGGNKDAEGALAALDPKGTWKRRMRLRPPPVRRRFHRRWDEIHYVHERVSYWLYKRKDQRKARRYVDRLQRLLKMQPGSRVAFFGRLCRSAIAEVRGDLEQAIEYRESIIDTIEDWFRRNPGQAREVVRVMTKPYYGGSTYGHVAKLYWKAGEKDRAINVLARANAFCHEHRIRFESQRLLDRFRKQRRAIEARPKRRPSGCDGRAAEAE